MLHEDEGDEEDRVEIESFTKGREEGRVWLLSFEKDLGRQLFEED